MPRGDQILQRSEMSRWARNRPLIELSEENSLFTGLTYVACSMWSHRFLWTGLISSISVAALALAMLWLVLFSVLLSLLGGNDPMFRLANIVTFALPGLVAYPAGWYMIIFRSCDYSLSRTTMLVAATLLAVSVMVAIFISSVGLYVSVTNSQNEGYLDVATSVAVAFFVTEMGAMILILPYMVVAMPIALLHRWLLLNLFASVSA
jgi:hypothetical protein